MQSTAQNTINHIIDAIKKVQSCEVTSQLNLLNLITLDNGEIDEITTTTSSKNSIDCYLKKLEIPWIQKESFYKNISSLQIYIDNSCVYINSVPLAQAMGTNISTWEMGILTKEMWERES